VSNKRGAAARRFRQRSCETVTKNPGIKPHNTNIVLKGYHLLTKGPRRTAGRLWKRGSWKYIPRVNRDRPCISREINAVKVVFKDSGLFTEDLGLKMRALHCGHPAASPCLQGKCVTACVGDRCELVQEVLWEMGDCCC